MYNTVNFCCINLKQQNKHFIKIKETKAVTIFIKNDNSVLYSKYSHLKFYTNDDKSL